MSLPQHVLHLSHTHPLARPKIKRVAAILPCRIAARLVFNSGACCMHLLLKFQGKSRAPVPCRRPRVADIARSRETRRDSRKHSSRSDLLQRVVLANHLKRKNSDTGFVPARWFQKPSRPLASSSGSVKARNWIGTYVPITSAVAGVGGCYLIVGTTFIRFIVSTRFYKTVPGSDQPD